MVLISFSPSRGHKRPVCAHAISRRSAKPVMRPAVKVDREGHRAMKEPPAILKVPPKVRRVEEVPHFLVSGEYDSEWVGPAGMALQEPAWEIGPSAVAEKSVSLCKGGMMKILRDHYENAEAFRFVQLVVAGKNNHAIPRNVNTSLDMRSKDAMNALRGLKMPGPVRDEFVRTCIKASMPVPLVPDDWAALWRELGAAFMAMLSIVVFQDAGGGEFGQDASILFKDRTKRQYSFTAIADSSRRVYVSVGLPHCQGQGIGAICGRMALDRPLTVHHPVRACAVDGGSKLVVLDVPGRMQIPHQISKHHREGEARPVPERTSFEGDNMLLVPCFRRRVFASIARLALETVELRAWQAMGDPAASMPKAAEIRGFVNPDLGLVVSSVGRTDIDTAAKPWALESRF